MIQKLFQRIVRYFRKGKASSYINDFLTSPNGVALLSELDEIEVVLRKSQVETLLVEEWLPNQKNLHKQVDFTLKYFDEMSPDEMVTELFDEPFRLVFSWDKTQEVQNLIDIQVITALGLSGQLHEKSNGLYTIIIEHDDNQREKMSAIRYKVCRVFDWGDFIEETLPVHGEPMSV